MIKKLSIRNFQSHKESELEFSDGVNVIIGGSDEGKSAIIRALLWGITNRPSGDAFRSDWGGDTVSDIELSGDIRVRRVKTDKASGNEYQLQNVPTEPFMVFKAMGVGVPDEINKAINITDINISRQHDAPFLLSDTPGAVAQMLNEIAGLDIIDRTQKNIESKLRAEREHLAIEEARLITEKAELKKYDYLDEMKKDVETLQMLNIQRDEIREKQVDIKTILALIYDIDDHLKELSYVDEAIEEIERILKLEATAAELEERRQKLEDTIIEIQDTEKELAELPDYGVAEILLESAMKADKKAEEMYTTIRKLQELIDSIELTDKEMTQIQTDIDKYETWWHENAGNKICPLCDGKGTL